jgi:hypothetical protein
MCSALRLTGDSATGQPPYADVFEIYLDLSMKLIKILNISILLHQLLQGRLPWRGKSELYEATQSAVET